MINITNFDLLALFFFLCREAGFLKLLLNLLILFYCIWVFYFPLESTSLGVGWTWPGSSYNGETSFSFRQGGVGGAAPSQPGWFLISPLSSSTSLPLPRGPAAAWERELPHSFCPSGRHRHGPWACRGFGSQKGFPTPRVCTHPPMLSSNTCVVVSVFTAFSSTWH